MKRGEQNSYRSAVLFSVLQAVIRNIIHRGMRWEPWKQKEKNTVSVQGTFPIDYASSRQGSLKGSQIAQPKLEKIQADICPSNK